MPMTKTLISIQRFLKIPFFFFYEENILYEDKQIEFDFLIAGQYVKETLEKHISAQDVETVCNDFPNQHL